MPLKIAADRTFTREVTVMAPVNGGHVEETFKATFRAIESKEVESFNLETVGGTFDFLKRVVVRLDDISDAEGKPLPYSDEVREQVLQMSYVRLALLRSYTKAIGSVKEGN